MNWTTDELAGCTQCNYGDLCSVHYRKEFHETMGVDDDGVLHVYANNTVDWYVAFSVKEAQAFYRERAREQGIPGCEWDTDFGQEPDEKVLRLDLAGDGDGVERTCSEWVALAGVRGFLATTEV